MNLREIYAINKCSIIIISHNFSKYVYCYIQTASNNALTFLSLITRTYLLVSAPLYDKKL